MTTLASTASAASRTAAARPRRHCPRGASVDAASDAFSHARVKDVDKAFDQAASPESGDL